MEYYYEYMARQQEPAFSLRFISMLRLPFELSVCLGAELLARLATKVDSARSMPEGYRCPADLTGVDPTVAFYSALRPHFGTFQHSVCEIIKDAKDSHWAAYDTQKKDAAKLAAETRWRTVIKAMLRRSFHNFVHLLKVSFASCSRSRCSRGRGQPAPSAASSRISRDKVLQALR